MTVRVIHGDCLAVLPTLATDGLRVHSVVCDPPYHLTSIVKRFGGGAAAPAQHGTDGAYARASKGFMGKVWDGGDVAFQVETWRRVYEVMLPGAFIIAFSSSRTFGRMSVAIEDAGFVTHPMLGWITGQGFPKAHRFEQPELEGWRYGTQALKPALEPIYMGQKPLDGTGSQNWARHGCGGLNIDESRIGLSASDHLQDGVQHRDAGRLNAESGFGFSRVDREAGLGRWPANVLHDGSDEVLAAFPEALGQQGRVGPEFAPKVGTACYGDYGRRPEFAPRGDTGSAARFFFSAKADASDRAGSKHPTVKPTDLMRWLVRLVTPPGGTVLDPFAGTGSTGLAADQLGMNAVLIEQDETYVADIRRKIAADAGMFAQVAE